jgi:ribonuclease HII
LVQSRRVTRRVRDSRQKDAVLPAGPVGRPGRRPLVHQGRELRCTFRFEDEARAKGYRFIAGVDEVGRGALCGPVVAGAVILCTGFDPAGIDDSKRLTRRQREVQASRIRSMATAWAVGIADAEEIDRLNILRATHLALGRALSGLGVAPDLVLVDGLRIPTLDRPQVAIVKGDAQSVTIAAASIVAKVVRDGMMQAWDRQHPGYGLARNMGYGSREHREALGRLGPSPIHRRSFHGTQRWLF